MAVGCRGDRPVAPTKRKNMADSNLKVHRFSRIGNFFLLVEFGEMTLIDTGARNSVKTLANKFRRLGHDLKDLKRIVITHCHFDHAGNLAALKRATGAKIMAHKDDVPYTTGQAVIPRPKGKLGPLFEIGEPLFRPESCDIDVPLNDGDIIAGAGLKVIHTPGHTPGHICLYHEETKALFSGDIMVNYMGYVVGPRPFFSSDIALARKSLEKLLDLDIKTIYFSHGIAKSKFTNGGAETIRKVVFGL